MKPLNPGGRKFLRIVHLVTASLWLGGAVGLYLMMLLLGPGLSGEELHGYDLARKFVDDFLIIPGALGCLITGFFISLLTPWGFARHRWVLVKWVLTAASILFGAFVLGPMVNGQPPISAELGLAALTDPTYQANRADNLLYSLAQLAAIFFMAAVSVLKPWHRPRKAG